MTVQELNDDQYKQLCQRYIIEMFELEGEEPTYYDLAYADELISRDVVYRYYAGIHFVQDDFS